MLSDIVQALSMLTVGVLFGALAWRLTCSDNRELQRVIDGHPVRPVWQRRADPSTPSTSSTSSFGHLDEVIERSAQQRRYQTTLPPVGSGAPRQLPAAPAGWEVSTSAPARDPNTNSDVIVPMMQSIITATVAALLLITLSLLAFRVSWQTTLRAAGVCWSVVLALAWLWRLGIVTGLLAEIESMTGRDLDGDGAIGKSTHAVLLDPGKARAAIAEELSQQDTAGETRRTHGLRGQVLHPRLLRDGPRRQAQHRRPARRTCTTVTT